MYTKKNAVAISDADRRVWELLTDVPKLKPVMAWICAILNFFFSGIGTTASAFLDGDLNKTQLFAGACQLLTSVYLIGWFMSIYWAYKLIMRSGRTDDSKKLLTAGQNSSQVANNPYAVLDE